MAASRPVRAKCLSDWCRQNLSPAIVSATARPGSQIARRTMPDWSETVSIPPASAVAPFLRENFSPWLSPRTNRPSGNGDKRHLRQARNPPAPFACPQKIAGIAFENLLTRKQGFLFGFVQELFPGS